MGIPCTLRWDLWRSLVWLDFYCLGKSTFVLLLQGSVPCFSRPTIDLQFFLIHLEYFLAWQFPRNKKASLQSRGKDVSKKLQNVSWFHQETMLLVNACYGPLHVLWDFASLQVLFAYYIFPVFFLNWCFPLFFLLSLKNPGDCCGWAVSTTIYRKTALVLFRLFLGLH